MLRRSQCPRRTRLHLVKEMQGMCDAENKRGELSSRCLQLEGAASDAAPSFADAAAKD